MLHCKSLHKIFKENGINYFVGVPDTILKPWINYIYARENDFVHRIAANEGAAIAHAAGYYLSTGKVGVVYMQNSGLGNAVNPLLSLADDQVFGIPMILMIGWRGEPDVKDEPQHNKAGRTTLPMLDSLDIPWLILNADEADAQIKHAHEECTKNTKPFALVVKKGMLEGAEAVCGEIDSSMLSREEAIKVIVDTFDGDEIVVSTTGKTSRELFEYRQVIKKGGDNDLYAVGSMGHASAIALDIACQKPSRRVYVFDGDGALIMHAGTVATIGSYAPANLIHIVFDNSSHESTGGQPTVSGDIDIAAIARGCGYLEARACTAKEDILDGLGNIDRGPAMLVIKVKKGSRKNLGRPSVPPGEQKILFMDRLLNG